MSELDVLTVPFKCGNSFPAEGLCSTTTLEQSAAKNELNLSFSRLEYFIGRKWNPYFAIGMQLGLLLAFEPPVNHDGTSTLDTYLLDIECILHILHVSNVSD